MTAITAGYTTAADTTAADMRMETMPMSYNDKAAYILVRHPGQRYVLVDIIPVVCQASVNVW